MKKYLFKVLLVTGATFTQVGEGYDMDEALMDACVGLANSEYPQDDIEDICLSEVEFK
jgi:hypothetical protein